MKKILIVVALFCLGTNVFANDEILVKINTIQDRVDNCGTRILNANQVPNRVVFVYSDEEKKSLLKGKTSLTERQVGVYANDYQFIENDDELAAYLARHIVIMSRSYEGAFKGFLRTLQMKASPKKFQVVADKIAVDFMVKADYNPLGLITYIHKTAPQKRFDAVSTQNLTSKRLAFLYEYIYTKYPYYLKNNSYLQNEHYQNFLLTSQHNRKMLVDKIKSGSKKELDYE